jgi:hypothetical protein
MIRRVIYVLAAVCAGLLAFISLRPSASTEPAPSQRAGIDWINLDPRDLNIAGVFLTARDSGVHRALDSLELLAAHDPVIRAEGHHLAHALGRFAIAQHKNDLSVIVGCRPIFEAGCYHGVLEGFLVSLKSLDSNTIASVCFAVEQTSPSRQPALECSHGLGHGLLTRVGYDLTRALATCDYLGADDARGECHDGVFMENVMHGLADSMITVGNAASTAHHQMMEMSGASPHREFFRKHDLAFPCDSVAAPYQSSCWSYQPLVAIQFTKANFQQTLHLCDKAIGAGATSCYRGFGKQSTGWYNNRGADIVRTCETATPPHVGDCLAGAVEAYVDYAWTPDRALEFCRAVPNAAKDGCYGEIGARMGFIRTDSSSLDRDCTRGEASYATRCLRNGLATLRDAQRVRK